MRYTHLKLQRGKATKAERVFAELLKGLRIPFKAKVRLAEIGGREIDFLIGKIAIEINGHNQLTDKNSLLLEAGYIPAHFTNSDVLDKREQTTKNVLSLIHKYETNNSNKSSR